MAACIVDIGRAILLAAFTVHSLVSGCSAHMQDITSIRKRKLHGLPNAIEIVCLGRAEVYSSFINRKEAYNLILDKWRECR